MKECFNPIVNQLSFLYARPKQALKTHLKNMIDQIPSVLDRINIHIPLVNKNTKSETWLSLDNKFLKIYLMLIYASHDFGKLSPVFQQKIQTIGQSKSKRAKGKCLIYSHHTQISSFFCYIILTQLLDKLIVIDNEITLEKPLLDDFLTEKTTIMNVEIIEELSEIMDIHEAWDQDTQLDAYKYILLTIGVFAVLMHHNRSLDSNANKFLECEDYLYDIMGLIFRFQSEYNKNIFLEVYENLIQGNFWKNILNSSIIVLNNVNEENYDDIFLVYQDLERIPSNLLNQKYSVYTTLFSFIFSCLTETDEWDAKSYIENTSDHHIKFEPRRLNINQNKIDDYRNLKFYSNISTINNKNKNNNNNNKNKNNISQLHQIRETLYDNLDKQLKQIPIDELHKIFVIDAPTGSGKTLTLLNAGIKCRARLEKELGYKPRIIYALPFISIIDQLGLQLSDIFSSELTSHALNQNPNIQNQYFTLHHHQAGDKWLQLEEETDDDKGDTIVNGNHFINTWHSEIIVTSFVRLFHTLLKSHKREFIRFHRLASSIILIDEIQGIPAKYWYLIQSVLVNISKILGCIIFLASATPPVALLPSHPKYVKDMNLIPREDKSFLNRYNINIKFLTEDGKQKITNLEDFVELLHAEIDMKNINSLMIVLNTTRAAYSVFDYLNTNEKTMNLFLLSSLILPKDRRNTIQKIKSILQNNKEQVVLVCTQVIEAGVDVSFQKIIRDYAPLDSLIQVAGRCNRSFEYDGICDVDIYQFAGDKGDVFSRIVYSEAISDLQETNRLLLSFNKLKISEQEITEKIPEYFKNLKDIKVTNKLVNEYFNGDFASLYKNFRLIDEKEYNETLLLGFTENFSSVKELMDKGVSGRFPKELSGYVLETSKSNLDFIKSQLSESKIFPIVNRKKRKIFTLLDLRDSINKQRVYSSQSGLRVKSIFDHNIK